MTSNAGQVTAQLMQEFGRLNTEIKLTQRNLAQLTTELRALSSSGRGINTLLAGFEKLGKARIGTGVVADLGKINTATRELQLVQAQLAKSAVETATAYRAMAVASRTMPRAPGGVPGVPSGSGGAGGPGGAAAAAAAARPARSASHSDRLNGAMGAQMAGSEGWSFFTKAIMAEAEVGQQLASFRMNNTVTDSDIANVRRAAERIVRETPGTTIAENLHHIVDAFTVTGDLNEALAGAPAVARMAYVLKNMPGAHKGDSSFAAMQAIEVMQRFYDPKTHQVSMEAFNQQLAAMTQVAAGTGGRVDGSAYLGFAKQARIGGMVANDQFLYRDLPAMLIALGGNRAGTGEAATFQQFVTGRMTARAAEQLKAVGILDQSATWKGGSVADMQKHMPGFDMFGTNPVEWVRNYMLGAGGALQRNKVDPNDRLAVAKFLSDWSSRQTGLGFMAEMTLGMGGINKEGQKIGQTTNNPMQVLQQHDPMQRMREFHAAENELMVTLGQNAIGPALEALKALTGVLRQLSEWGKAHPNAAGDITLIVGGLSALATAAGNAAMVLFVGAPLVTGLRVLAGAMSPFAAGGAAAGAMATLPAGLSGVGIALVALAGAVVGIPKIFEGIAGALGLQGGQALHGGGKGDRTGIAPNASGASPWGALGNLFGGGGAQNPASSGPSHGGGKGSRQGITPSPSSYYMRPAEPTVIQATFISQIDGREVSRTVSRHQARELSRPPQGMTGFDLRMTPMFPGAGTVAI